MKTISKSLIGAVAAGAMAMASTAPAHARGDRDGIGAGEIIAGALIIGGIAAVASAASSNRDRYGYDDRYRGGGRYNDNPRDAVELCVRSAERDANRYSSVRGADVTDIRSVQNTRKGYTVKGRIAVNTQERGWRSGDRRYGDGWNGDYRGWNNRLSGYDSGNFTCKVEYGRIVDLRFSGIRGLR